jgi:cytochrome P450
VCNEDTELSFEGKSVLVEKGIHVNIPILSLHYDPEYYLEPTQFYPERFDDGSIKTYRDRGVFLPFGIKN